MKSTGERIKTLRQSLSMTQKELGDAIGVKTAAINKYETGTVVNLKRSTIQNLAKALHTSPTYLLGYTEDTRPLPANAVALKDIPRKRIPVLGVIAAGAPIMADREYDEAVYVDADSRADFAIRVEGDSMIPLYQPGDLVYFREQDCVDNGQIAAVLVDGSTAAALKRFYYKDGVVTLASENPRYAPMVFPNPSDVRVLGVPVGFQRMY